MSNSTVIYWLLNFSMPEFQISPTITGKSEGKILIASRQLYTLMAGEEIRSCLIGPGVVQGVHYIHKIPTEFQHPISAVIFDPTQLRRDEPIPLVDIINPEVIDPVAASERSAIEQRIISVMVRRGKVLAARKLIEIRPPTGVPLTAIEEEDLVRVNINYVNGLAKAKFVLGAQNRKQYQRLLEELKKEPRTNPFDTPVLRSDQNCFKVLTEDSVSKWLIVEKMQGAMVSDQPPTFQLFKDDYFENVQFIFDHKKEFIF